MCNHYLYNSARVLVGILLSLWFCETIAFSQQPAAIRATQQMPISLSQALQMALVNNKDVEIARQTVLAADWDLKGVLAQYQTRSTFSSSYEHAKTPVSSFLSGGVNGSVVQSGLMAGYRLGGFAPKGGGDYEFSFSSQRFTTNNLFAALSPQYPSDLMFRFTQPISRGRDFSTRLKDIAIAKKTSELTDTQFRHTVSDTILNVKRAYWDLVFARSNLTIQSEVLADIREQLDLTKRRIGNGTLAAISVARPEARAAESEQNVYRALEDVSRAENAIKNLIAETSTSALWETSLVPTETVDPDIPLMTLQQALSTALDNRVELQEADVVREINAIEQRYFRDQTRPQIDLTSSYGITGLSGSFVNNLSSSPLTGQIAQVQFPPFLEGGYGQSLTNLVENRFNTFRVGVQFELPLHNRGAEAKLGRAVVEEKRVITQREKLKQLVQMDVRNAYQAAYVADSRHRSASVIRADFEQQYASDQRRLNVGYSTTDVVLEGQIALALARIGEMRAQTEKNKALAELERSMGIGIEASGIVVRSR